MKKFFVSILIVLILLTSLSGCLIVAPTPTPDSDPDEGEQNQGTENEGNGQEITTPQDMLAAVAELSKKSYSKVTVSITTVTGDINLKAKYVVTESSVTYEVEQMSLLPSVDGVESTVPEYKVKLSGVATVENGVVTRLDGDEVSIPDYSSLSGAFKFDTDNLKNVYKQGSLLYADASSVAEFFGVERELGAGKLVIDYTDEALNQIIVSYTDGGSKVTAIYRFEK